jgi:hypothetical protein
MAFPPIRALDPFSSDCWVPMASPQIRLFWPPCPDSPSDPLSLGYLWHRVRFASYRHRVLTPVSWVPMASRFASFGERVLTLFSWVLVASPPIRLVWSQCPDPRLLGTYDIPSDSRLLVIASWPLLLGTHGLSSDSRLLVTVS